MVDSRNLLDINGLRLLAARKGGTPSTSAVLLPVPPLALRRRVSTSYVERHNLSMRTDMRRLTRLTNAFSKKRENLSAALALYFAYYNFVRIHRTLRVSPAMEAGVADRLWSITDLVRAG